MKTCCRGIAKGKVLLVGLPVVLIALYLVCCREADIDPHVIPLELTKQESVAIDSANEFSLSLVSQIWKQKPDSNICISPASVRCAFGMVAAGAQSDTLQQLEKVTGFREGKLDPGLRALLTHSSHAATGCDLRLANRIYIDLGLQLNPSFRKVCEDSYSASVAELDLQSVNAVSAVNDWISENTDRRISHAVDNLGQNDALVSVNALSFRGDWTIKFDQKDTRSGRFTRFNGQVAQIPMMLRRRQMALMYQSPEFDALKLPFSNGTFAMVIVLPSRKGNIPDTIRVLQKKSWRDLLTKFTPRKATVRIPKWKQKGSYSLKEPFERMGVITPFHPSRGFSGISSNNSLYISRALHSAEIEVDEQGARAAASTEIIMTKSSDPNVFVADRPFIFSIIDTRSGTLVMVGVFGDPNQL